MTVRANWFTAQAPSLDDEPDPFSIPIEEIGQRIDLRDPRAALLIRIRELLYREAALSDAQVMCVIKDRADTTCHACPVSKAHDRTQALGVLCRVGREQEVALTELAVLGCQDR
jgi:hypothetical protein